MRELHKIEKRLSEIREAQGEGRRLLQALSEKNKALEQFRQRRDRRRDRLARDPYGLGKSKRQLDPQQRRKPARDLGRAEAGPHTYLCEFLRLYEHYRARLQAVAGSHDFFTAA